MATAIPPYLYLLDEDLYRLGNAASPKLHNARPGKDIETYDRNSIVMVRSNGQGISLITEERFERERARHRLLPLEIARKFPLAFGPRVIAGHQGPSPRSRTRPLPFMPTGTKNMMYDFDNWRANMVLEALQALDEKWTAIRDAAAANGDDDTAADYGSDMMRLSILREGFEAKATEAFGANVTKLSGKPCAPVTIPNGEHPLPR